MTRAGGNALLALVLCAVLAIPALAYVNIYTDNAVSVTATSASIDFADATTSASFNATTVLIVSADASTHTCYAWMGEGDITAAGDGTVAIPPGKTYEFSVDGRRFLRLDGWDKMAHICANGESAIWQVVATR